MRNFKPQRMVGWYEVEQLAGTAIRAILSSIFGSYADKRETLASLSKPKVYEYHDKRTELAENTREEIYQYENERDLWFDYISDTGDGFNSTFSMAHLIAQPEIEVTVGQERQKLPRGKIVVFGGDQVYPTPSRTEYENRFIGPFSTASIQANPETKSDLYALPGNHDWYDGLTNFVKIFCNNKNIGNFNTQQNRSYFALKLKENVWLWGIDVQLQSDIDELQIEYFDWVAKNHMSKGSNVILCTAEPAWVYHTQKQEDHSYDSLEAFEINVIQGNGMKQILTLAGDLHHYARYSQEQPNQSAKHKITAGGGGAFLHPTHNLPDKLENLHDGEFELQKTFPTQKVSKGITWLNLLFPSINPGFGLFLSSIHLVMAYALYSTSLHDDLPGTLFSDFSEPSSFLNPLIIQRLFTTFIHSPLAMLVLITFIFGFKAFCDGKSSRYKLAQFAGIAHGLAHIWLMITIFCLTTWFTNDILEVPSGYQAAIVISLLVFFLGGWLSGMLVGFYLIVSNLIFKMHDNEAFSSLKMEGYKNFLRFHLEPHRLTIYPIGLKKAPGWKKEQNKFNPTSALKPELIDEKIVIDL